MALGEVGGLAAVGEPDPEPQVVVGELPGRIHAVYKAPPGKAWKIVGKASRLGEEVYIMAGAYYDTAGRIVAGPGTFMFNAPGAVHGGISCDLTLYIHCCSGEPDEIISVGLIDFEPKEKL